MSPYKSFQVVILILCYSNISTCIKENMTSNFTSPKDMYVVRATVYQVGILTNRTNNTADPSTYSSSVRHSISASYDGKLTALKTLIHLNSLLPFMAFPFEVKLRKNFNRSIQIGGHQEAITIYRNKGLEPIDLSTIHNPLLTNITAENIVGVAPVSNETIPWNKIKHLVSSQDDVKIPRLIGTEKVALDADSKKSKRDVSTTPMEIVKGSAVIPSEAGIHSIALPPLITFNKNLSKIPVPIPNMSVVSYAKVNTLVHSP